MHQKSGWSAGVCWGWVLRADKGVLLIQIALVKSQSFERGLTSSDFRQIQKVTIPKIGDCDRWNESTFTFLISSLTLVVLWS